MGDYVERAYRRRVIIESPFAGDVERNLRYLRACMRDSLLRGESPYASHGLYTQPGVLDDTVPEERLHGIHAGFVWREVAGLTAVYTDLGISSGMEYGIRDAEKLRDLFGKNDHDLEYRTLGGSWETDPETMRSLDPLGASSGERGGGQGQTNPGETEGAVGASLPSVDGWPGWGETTGLGTCPGCGTEKWLMGRYCAGCSYAASVDD